MKRFVFSLIALCLLFSYGVKAQAATQTLKWSYLGTSLATVNSYQQFLKVNTGTNNAIAPSCVTQGADTVCSLVMNPQLKTGDIVTVTASANGQSASGTLTVGTGPQNPTSITITIVIQ